MKRKEILHPRIYLRILEKKDSIVKVEYKDNEFNNTGKRIIKKVQINLDEYLNNFSDDFSEILDKLNNQELNKITNYIKTQYKVLKYHVKKNNHDSIGTVQTSIKLMEKFKKQLTQI